MVSLKDIQEPFSQRFQTDLAKKLIKLTKRNGYEIIQTNGQRVYAPSASSNLPHPAKGCEVFIGKLHKNLYEDELIPLFERIGPLYKFRLMLDFMERTRGYAFATYFYPEDANRAVIDLHNFEIRPRLHIGVYKSVDNCRLFIGNVPTDKSRDEVFEILNLYAVGVSDVIMYPQYDDPTKNRGFVFAEFDSHRSAAMARRQFTPENLIAWGQSLYVDWADPLPEVDPSIMDRVTVLYLRNLPTDYTSEEIHTSVCNAVGSQTVRKVHKMYNYGFVHFINRRSAEIGFEKLKNFMIGINEVDVEWARPRSFSKRNRLNDVPNNFCTSVPPNMRRMVHQRTGRNKKYINKIANPSSSTSSSSNTSSSNSHAGADENSYSSENSDPTTSEGEYSYFMGRSFFG